MDVTVVAERDVMPERQREILLLQHAAFPGTGEFAYQRWYRTPLSDDDLWFLARRGGQFIGSVRLLHRRITTVRGDLAIGGVANVCSHPSARGSGAARACMLGAQQYIAGGTRTDFGMLFTGPKVREFYAKLGWRGVKNPLVYADESGNAVRVSPEAERCVMIFASSRPLEQWPEGEININGPAW